MDFCPLCTSAFARKGEKRFMVAAKRVKISMTSVEGPKSFRKFGSHATQLEHLWSKMDFDMIGLADNRHLGEKLEKRQNGNTCFLRTKKKVIKEVSITFIRSG